MLVESLSSLDILDNLALAQEVGWADDEADWRVLHEAALVMGIRRSGKLVGQAALGAFEPGAGTIAKMIVAPSAQRQGLGAAILDALLEQAERRSLGTLGLVATPQGRRLYEGRGFDMVGEVAVFIGTPALDEPNEIVSPVLDLDLAIAFERRFVSCSRAAMLRARHREASTAAIHRSSDGTVHGFALATRKGQYAMVGPVIADSEDAARTLTRGIFSASAGAVRIDVPTEHSGFRAWLLGLGLAEKGLRPEMARGGPLPWRVPQRFALAAQAWG